jgi:hypothetical protein
MNKDTALVVSDILVSIYQSLHDSIDLVRTIATDEENKTYCRLAGRALGYMLLDLMIPLYKAHAEPMPEFLQQSAAYPPAEREVIQSQSPPRRLTQDPEQATDTEPGSSLEILMDRVVMKLEETMALVEGACSEAESKDYHDKAAEILSQIADAKAYISAKHLDARAAVGRSGR